MIDVKNRQILVAGALLYAKKQWGKANYYKDPLADNRGGQEAPQEESPWYYQETFIIDTETEEVEERSFAEEVVGLIDQRRLTDAEVFAAAGLSRPLYSRMVNARSFTPSKDICVAILFALNADEELAQTLLSYAGYILDHENKRDLYIEYLFTEQKFFETYGYGVEMADAVLTELGCEPLQKEM